jgi:ABC-type nitrate/sulfonate/bicarbonate transport system substrate-binding protein
MNLTRPAALFLAGLLTLASGAAGCNKSVPAPEPAPQPKPIPKAADFKMGPVLEVPFILWGGDVATFHANGGLDTKKGTLFANHGVKLNLVRGVDFDKQVENYITGKSAFLRGTVSMLGQASESLCADERTKPVVFLQLTWSAGDHLVSRAGMKTLADLRGKRVALQKGGPHVGMLNDILRTARLTWADIGVEWTEDVTGDKGPAEKFRKDSSIDACFAITPDMEDLTGGLDKTGDGKGKTVQGAHVLVSTAHMSRSIADVYACRKDFYDKHKDIVEKFAAAYLKGCEELVAMKKKQSAPYKALLKLTQDIYGKKDISDEKAADGLVSDAAFVGLPGNKSFFTDEGNLSGFKAKMKAALDLAVELKDATARHEFLTAGLDYNQLKQLGGLTDKPIPASRFRDDAKFLIQDTIYVFTINFEPNQSTFPEAKYGEDFQRALEMASLFGNTVMAVRGHADAMNVLNWFAESGLKKGALRRGAGEHEYILKDGTKLNLTTDAKKVVELIKKDDFGDGRLRLNVTYLQDLSEKRANAVRDSVVGYALKRKYRLDKSQIRGAGAGMTEPVIALPDPNRPEEWTKNRRVEFRIIKVAPEAIKVTDFDY